MITRTSAATCPTCLAPPKPHNPEDTGHTEDQLQITTAMTLLHSGVDITVIAMWLGHESTDATQIYLHADMSIKERALARTTLSSAGTLHRYKPPDALLAFLATL